MHKGIGGVWAATSQLLLCKGRMDDLFQLTEYSEILENDSIRFIVSCSDEGGSCRNSKISSA